MNLNIHLMKNRNIFLHDKKRKVEAMPKEVAKEVNAKKSYERHYQKNHILRVLNKKPEKPIGYFTNSITNEIIQTTDENGMVNVNEFVLQFGRISTRVEPKGHYTNHLTEQLSKIIK